MNLKAITQKLRALTRKANTKPLTTKEQWELIDSLGTKAILNDGGIENTHYYVNPKLSVDNIPNRFK